MFELNYWLVCILATCFRAHKCDNKSEFCFCSYHGKPTFDYTVHEHVERTVCNCGVEGAHDGDHWVGVDDVGQPDRYRLDRENAPG